MSLMDSLGGDLNAFAGKFGLKPDHIKALIATLESKLTNGEDRAKAIQSAARQHGIAPDKVRDILNAAGGGLAEQVKRVGQTLLGSRHRA
jgi:hypothetical protein